jgi:hypothetical protein
VFALSGEFEAAVGSRERGLSLPYDVLECASDGSFIVANSGSNNVVKIRRDGSKAEVIVMKGGGNGDFLFTNPAGVAALPGGAMLVRDCGGARCSIIRDHGHRMEWIGACVSAALV